MEKTKVKFIKSSIALLAIILMLIITTPVLAIDAPTTRQIDSVYVFHHCLETDDQLYIAEYTIEYGTNPDESITEAFLARFMDDDIDLKSVAPYNYFDQGYGTGIFAIYFSASDDNLPIWEGMYSIHLEGNPTANWTGEIPTTSADTFDSWSDSTSVSETQDELASRILYMADKLEQDWGINMIDTTGSASYLSDYGQDYFTNVIPNLLTMAPGAFPGSVTSPEWSDKDHDIGTAYADERADNPDNTLLDMSSVGDWWGVSRMWASSILFILGAVFLIWAMLSPTGNYRGLTLLSTPLVIAGGYLGMLPLLVTVLIGFAAFALTIFMLFYHPSSA